MFLGILWFSIKEIEVPYVFDWQHGIRLHANRGIGTHLAARGKTPGFSRVDLGYNEQFHIPFVTSVSF